MKRMKCSEEVVTDCLGLWEGVTDTAQFALMTGVTSKVTYHDYSLHG